MDALAKQARNLRVVTIVRGTDKRVLIRLCVCVCMTMLGAFFGGRMVCKVEKERRVTVPASRNVVMSACNKCSSASRA